LSQEPVLQPFRSIAVWQKSHELTLNVFRITDVFPKTESFGLSVQLRRASMTIPLKIAEGCGQDDNSEFHRRLVQARGTCVELEYLFLLARDLRFIEPPAYDALQNQLIEVRKMLSGFMKTLHSQPV
jgi:four helix bundle protein